jgi:glycosyltransferase involved in cell wall biosynthesis
MPLLILPQENIDGMSAGMRAIPNSSNWSLYFHAIVATLYSSNSQILGHSLSSMQGPLVTVVTPSYNHGHFIRATIESVLSQDYPHVEYIIMDGGSTDETASVVKDYAGRVTFISEKDRGQSHAINKAFQLARGSILAWLNSDDLYLPGAIGKAVDAFQRNPTAGAVYGEGYLIDRSGQTSSRFPASEAFNLWKLVYLSDYILQQTVYFRKDVLDEIGLLDEDLHYTMDWDLLIRIGKKYPLEYIPEYMGCLREYPEAKSSAGGAPRIREIRDLLRRHTGMRIPHGYITYGLDTYHRIWCEQIERLFTPKLKSISEMAQYVIRCSAGFLIGRTIRESQGLYSDQWASRQLRYMLPPGDGGLVIEGSLPEYEALQAQEMYIEANGQQLGQFHLPFGDFQLTVPLPPALQGQLLHLTIETSRWFSPCRFTLHGDRRRLAYKLKSIRWAQTSEPVVSKNSNARRAARI